MMSPWPLAPLLRSGPIGAGLLEEAPSSRRPGQAMASVSSVGPPRVLPAKQSQKVSEVQGPHFPHLGVCAFAPLLPQLLRPAFTQGSEASHPAP